MKVLILIASIIASLASLISFSLLSIAKQWIPMGIVGVCLVGSLFTVFLSIVELFKEDRTNGRN